MHLKLHKHMTNQEIADVFDFIAQVLRLQNANPFRSRAYDNAATTIALVEGELHKQFLENPNFDKIPGIGDTLNQKLTELFTTGNIRAFQEYVAEIPGAVFPLTLVHGIGVKKAYKITTAFNLQNPETALADVAALAQAGKIRELESFGEKSEADILEAISQHQAPQRLPFAQALAEAEHLVNELKHCPAIERIEVLGSLRRQSETVGDIDLGIATDNIQAVQTFIEQLPSVKRVLVAGSQLIRINLQTNRQVDIKVSPKSQWGAFLQHFTGSKEHNIKLRELAIKQGKSLSEHGIKVTQPDGSTQLKKFADEAAFYHNLGLAWIEPRHRLGGKEIENAQIKFKAGQANRGDSKNIV